MRETYKETVAKSDDHSTDVVGKIERFKFCGESKDCCCVVQTGETVTYENFTVPKGVIKQLSM